MRGPRAASTILRIAFEPKENDFVSSGPPILDDFEDDFGRQFFRGDVSSKSLQKIVMQNRAQNRRRFCCLSGGGGWGCLKHHNQRVFVSILPSPAPPPTSLPFYFMPPAAIPGTSAPLNQSRRSTNPGFVAVPVAVIFAIVVSAVAVVVGALTTVVATLGLFPNCTCRGGRRSLVDAVVVAPVGELVAPLVAVVVATVVDVGEAANLYCHSKVPYRSNPRHTCARVGTIRRCSRQCNARFSSSRRRYSSPSSVRRDHHRSRPQCRRIRRLHCDRNSRARLCRDSSPSWPPCRSSLSLQCSSASSHQRFLSDNPPSGDRLLQECPLYQLYRFPGPTWPPRPS